MNTALHDPNYENLNVVGAWSAYGLATAQKKATMAALDAKKNFRQFNAWRRMATMHGRSKIRSGKRGNESRPGVGAAD